MKPEQKKSFFSLLTVLCLDNFGWGVVFVFFGTLLLDPQSVLLPPETSIKVRNIYLGILFAAFPLTQLFAAPLLGDYADLVGRKKALYISILGTVFGYILSGVAILFEGIYLLIISRLITGFFAGNMSICLASVADLSQTEKQRSRNFSIVTVVWGVSWPFAMLAGGYLSNPSISPWFSPSFPFWLTAFLSFVSFVIVYFFYIETYKTQKKIKIDLLKGMHNILQALRIKELRIFFLVLLSWSIGWGLSVQWFGTFSILEYHIPQTEISWALLIQGIFWTIGGPINALLIRHKDSLWVACFGMLFCSLFLFLTTFTHRYITFDIGYFIAATFSAFSFSNVMNLISIHAAGNIQGTTMGITQSFNSLGFLIVPIIGGVLGGVNAKLFYPLSAALIFIGFILLLIRKRRVELLR